MVQDSVTGREKVEISSSGSISEPLDVRHISCPPALWVLIPVMKRAEKGEVIQVLTTDTHDKEDIEHWVRKTGKGIVNVVPEEGYERILIRKEETE